MPQPKPNIKCIANYCVLKLLLIWCIIIIIAPQINCLFLAVFDSLERTVKIFGICSGARDLLQQQIQTHASLRRIQHFLPQNITLLSIIFNINYCIRPSQCILQTIATQTFCCSNQLIINLQLFTYLCVKKHSCNNCSRGINGPHSLYLDFNMNLLLKFDLFIFTNVMYNKRRLTWLIYFIFNKWNAIKFLLLYGGGNKHPPS